MTSPTKNQIALNGFEALPDAEKKWFLVRVRSLSHAFTSEKQAAKRSSVV